MQGQRRLLSTSDPAFMINLTGEKALSLYAQVVERVADILGDDFFVCGATARDVLLTHVHKIDTGRATQDFDLGVMVRDLAQFQSLRTKLLESAQFKPDIDIHRLRFGTVAVDLLVDLIPFGGVERADRQVDLPPGDMSINTLGYREAVSSVINVLLPGNVRARIVSLPMQTVLKLVAWGDMNPKRGNKDAQDFRMIAWNYERVVGTARITDYPELFDRPDFDVNRAGAWVLGFDAGQQIVAEGSELYDRLLFLLDPASVRPGPAELAVAMNASTASENLALVEWYRDGLSRAMAQVVSP